MLEVTSNIVGRIASRIFVANNVRKKTRILFRVFDFIFVLRAIFPRYIIGSNETLSGVLLTILSATVIFIKFSSIKFIEFQYLLPRASRVSAHRSIVVARPWTKERELLLEFSIDRLVYLSRSRRESRINDDSRSGGDRSTPTHPFFAKYPGSSIYRTRSKSNQNQSTGSLEYSKNCFHR